MSIEDCRKVFKIPAFRSSEMRCFWELVSQQKSGDGLFRASSHKRMGFEIAEGHGSVSLSDLFQELAGEVVGQCINPQHPLVLGHMHPPPAAVSVLGDFLVGALNQCAFIWEEAPLAAAMEESVIQWLCRRVGMASGAGGLLTSGGTMSNFLAAFLALSQLPDVRRKQEREKLSIVCSDQAHFSVQKAAILLGLEKRNVVRVGTDSMGRLVRGAIISAVRAELLAGRYPFLVVCTAGTTNGGTVENAREFIEAARLGGGWCHIDAAHGGIVCLSPKYRLLADEWRQSDSVSWDPHKGLYVSYSSGALLLRDADKSRALEFHSEYALKDDETEDAGYRHFEGSRRFEALKIWMTIKHIGAEHYREIVEYLFGLAQDFSLQIKQSADFELFCAPDTNIVCFRYVGSASSQVAPGLNGEIQKTLYRTGVGPLVSSTKLKGDTYLRVVLTNPATEASHLSHLLQRVRQEALAIQKRGPIAA